MGDDGKKAWKFDTLQVHAGQQPDPTTGARAVPIYLTTSFVFESVEQGQRLAAFEEVGHMYTRIGNPTNDVLEQRIAALEGGAGALAVASGSAAVTYSILNIAGAGDEIVAARTLYGGTFNLFDVTLPKIGIRTKFVDPDDPGNFRAAITDRTKAVFIETIGNPGINLVDIEAVAAIAHERGIPLIVDNTFGTPYLIRPIEHGADIVVHSATKYIGGHGTSIGGLIVDGGRFDWGNGKFPGFTEPDKSYNGIRFYEKFGELAYITKARVQWLRDTGASISPFNVFLLLQGLETLSLRVEKHLANAKRVAAFLNGHPDVAWVNYPALEGNRYYSLSQKYFPKGPGSIFTFGLKGGFEAAKRTIDGLKLFSLLANVADAKSLVIHPASTTHAQLTPQEQADAGVTPDLIRLSIGIEMKNVYARKQLWLSSVAVLTAVALLSGCGKSGDKNAASGESPSKSEETGGEKPLKKITFAYAGGTCEAPIYTAIEKGFFKEEGLDVELVQQDFETLKSGIASGKVDGTVGNFAWFKPIEQGLDVKLTGGLHAGCIQLVTPGDSGITDLKGLKGKTIGVDVIGGGPQITLSIALKQSGLDPQKDVQWRAYPSQQLSTAADKGEIQAFIVWDPAAQQAIDEKNYVRLLSNGHDEPFKSGYCCYSVISGKLAKEDPEKAAAITRALLKAADWVGRNAHETAEIETNKKYVPADVATNEALLADYHWKPGVKTAQESAKFFIKYQKELGILDSSTDETDLYNRAFFEAIPDFNGR